MSQLAELAVDVSFSDVDHNVEKVSLRLEFSNLLA